MAFVEHPEDDAPAARPPEPSPILSSICNLLGALVVLLGVVAFLVAANDSKIGVGFGIGTAVAFLAIALLLFGIGQAVRYLARAAGAAERTAEATERIAAKWLD